jgi:adenosylcobyric acid synthase
MRARGWDRFIANHRAEGNYTVGICGGYQMMGLRIDDPKHVESDVSTVEGLGIFDVVTTFELEKTTRRTEAVALASGLMVSGYEIHAGLQTRLGGEAAFKIQDPLNGLGGRLEVSLTDQGKTIGTSIHGVFDTPEFRRAILNQVRKDKGLNPLELHSDEDAKSVRGKAYDRFARLLR